MTDRLYSIRRWSGLFNLRIVTRYAAAILFSMAGFSMTGCGGGTSSNAPSEPSVDGPAPAALTATTNSEKASDSEPAQVSEAQTSASQPVTTAAPTIESKLSGVWYGESNLDIDAVNDKLSTLPPEQALQLQQKIATFHSIVMAAEYRPDAVMEMDMMLTTHDGQQMRDRAVGKWKVIAATEKRVQIETSEYVSETENPVQKILVFDWIDQDHFQFVPSTIAPELLEFSPRIIFQRLDEPFSDESMAEQPTDTEIR